MSQPRNSGETKKRSISRSPQRFAKRLRLTSNNHSNFSREDQTTEDLTNSTGTLLSSSANGNVFSGSIENFQSNNVIEINCKQIIHPGRYPELRCFLSPLDNESLHCTIREGLAKGTGGWLLQNEKFLKWKGGKGPQILCLLGEPGTGKTSLLCHVIEALRSDQAAHNSVVSFVYCDYQYRAQQTARKLIEALFWRILAYFEPGDDVVTELQARCTYDHSLSTGEYTDYLCRAAKTGRFTFLWLCLDAIDELDPSERDAILLQLRIISASPVFRIFLTGRSNAGVDSSICRLIEKAIPPVATEYFSISTKDSSGDIRNFLKEKLEEDSAPSLMNNELRASIFHRLAERGSTFLLAALNIKLVLAEGTIRERKQTLSKLVLNLESYYEEMVKRIQRRDRNYGMKILQWILLSIRPLTVQELRYAIAIRPEERYLNPCEDLPALSILDSTLGLVTEDAWSRTVRFVHFTFKEHLLSHSFRYFPTGHTLLARVTLAYMTFDTISSTKGRERYLQGGDLSPFYFYACENCGHHARQNESREVIESLCCLLEEGKLSSIRAINNATSMLYGAQAAFYSSAAHVLAYFGLSSTFAHVVSCNSQTRIDLNSYNKYVETPFSYAMHYRHTSIIKQLLEQSNFDVNRTDCHGLTPLFHAVVGGHTNIVSLLLRHKGVDVNLADPGGWTCLTLAAHHGWANTVELLLQRTEIDVNMTNAHGKTPLFLAATAHRTIIVTRLLQRKDVNLTGKDGQALLMITVIRGWLDIVTELLERREIAVNLPNKFGRTALHIAVQLCHIDIISYLCQRKDIDVNVADKDGWTPFSFAAESGRVAVAELFLKRKEVNVNIVNKHGWSPLMSAVIRGYIEIVKLLLERPDVDVNFTDTKGRTSLLYAVDNIRTDIAKELLSRNETSVNARDVEGWSPLLIAVDRGDIEIMDVLLARKDIDVNLAGADGWSPLLVAADNGHIEIAERLLARRDINVSLTDDEHQAVLSSLEGGDNDTAVNLLFQAKYKCTNGRGLRRFRNGSESLDD